MKNIALLALIGLPVLCGQAQNRPNNETVHGTVTLDKHLMDTSRSASHRDYNRSPASVHTWDGDQADYEWDEPLNWEEETVPNGTTHDVEIPAGLSYYPIISDQGNVCGALTIVNGASMTVGPGADLSVNATLTANEVGNIIIESTSGGTGSLYHTSDDVNATIKRYITGNSDLAQYAYHLVSVPLRSDNLNLFSQLFLGSYLFDFRESQGSSGEWYSYGTSTTTALAVEKGYMIYYPGTSHIYSFPGKLNNGSFSCSVDYTDPSHGYNLVPNPYSFDIDWDAGSGWAKSDIGGSIWIWNPTEKQYGVYNGSGTHGVTNKIAVGQAFFVQATGDPPSLSMTNAVKTTGATFLKETSELKDFLFIKVSAGEYGDEAIVQFRQDGSFQVDPLNDAAKFYGADFTPQLYTLAEGEPLSINSLPYSFDEILVPLGIEYISNESCTLTFEDIKSFASTTSIQLQDLVTGEMINLRQNPNYAFTYNTNDDPARFVLHFNGITSIDDAQQDWAHIYQSGDKLVINISNPSKESGIVEIFNTSGQRLSSTQIHGQEPQTVDFNYPRGLYLVKLSLNDQIIVKKIIQ